MQGNGLPDLQVLNPDKISSFDTSEGDLIGFHQHGSRCNLPDQ